MNERIRYPLVITVICAVAAAALAYTYALTKDRIRESKRSDLVKGLEKVLPPQKKSIEMRTLPGVEAQQPEDDQKLYVARENAGQTGRALGYAAIGSAQGYSSKVKVIVGVDPDMRIIAARILDQQETPGLGERAREVPATKTLWQALADIFRGSAKGPELVPPFQQQFSGKTWQQLELTNDADAGDRIIQLTGATITSRAVVNAAKDAITKIETALRAEELAGTEHGGE